MPDQVLSRKVIQLIVDGSQVDKSSKRIETSLERIRRSASTVVRAFGALGVGLSLGAFTTATRRAVEFADTIGKTADRIGFGVEALQELRFAGELTGVGVKQLDIGLQRFSRRAADAANGSGELAKVFKAQGIALRDSNGAMRSSEVLLNEYADAIARAGSDQEALLLAFKAFDSEGAALVNTLRNGAAGLDELRAQAREAGLVIEEDLVRTAEDLNDRWTTVSREFQTKIGVRILSALETVASEGPKIFVFMSTRIAQALAILDTVFRSGFDGLVTIGRTAFELLLVPVRAFFEFVRSGFDKLAELGQVDVFGKTFDLGGGFAQVSSALGGIIDQAPALGDAARAFADANPELQASITLLEDFGQQELLTIDRQQDLQEQFRETARERRKAFANLNSPAAPSRTSSRSAPRARVDDSAARAAEAAQQALQGQADRIRQTTRTAEESLEAEIALLNRLREANAQGQITGFDGDTFTRGIEAAQERYEQAFDRIGDKSEETFDSMSAFADQASRNMQSAFADFLFDPFDGGLKGMVDGFTDTLRRMAAEAAASAIFDGLSQQFGGGSGGLVGGLLGSVFGGFRADGGPVAAGTPYVVGERGPELFVPRQAGNVVPNSETAQQRAITINNNVTVNASGGSIDKRSQSQILTAVATGTQRALARNT